MTAITTSLPSADTAWDSAWAATKTLAKLGHLRPVMPNHRPHACNLTHGKDREPPPLFISSLSLPKVHENVSKRTENSKLLTKAISFKSQVQGIFSLFLVNQ